MRHDDKWPSLKDGGGFECRKVKHGSEREAKATISRIRNLKVGKHYKKKIPIRCYLCEYCGFWHTTSKR